MDSVIHLLNNWDLAPVVQKMESAIQRISVRETNCAIHWIEIYPVDSVIHLLNNWDLAPVVQKLNSAIHWINHYPTDKC